MSNSIVVKVPATTANLGAGFDCLGAALSLENQFQFSLSEEKTTFTVTGDGAEQIHLTGDNLLYQSFLHFYDFIDVPAPKVEIKIDINVPLARGLGSSATAIIGGLLAANHFSPRKLSQTELLNLAIAIEGHPDNVVPALLGNCILAVGEAENWQFVPITCNPEIKFIIAIPNFELSTEAARAVLPPHLSYSDAVYNMAHLSLLIKGLETGNPQWLTEALKDKLHQPYRKSLIKGYDRLYENVLDAGAYGMVISGAGPTLLALSNDSHKDQVIKTMQDTWENLGVKALVKCLDLQSQGAQVKSV
jgi:homoserine kinase